MLNYVAAILLLVSLGDAFQGYKIMGFYQRRSLQHIFAMSEDLTDFTVTELKNKLRDAGMPLTGTKKDLIARLIPGSSSSKAPIEESISEEKTHTVKTTKRLGGLLRRKPKISGDSTDVAVSKEVQEIDTEESVFVEVPLPKKQTVKPVVAKQWESRKELVEKTPAVKVVVPVVQQVETEKVIVKEVKIDSKKPVKGGKAAAYDIDDDDFMDSFMDSGSQPAQQQQPQREAASSSSSKPVDGDRPVWPGPGKPWMAGPVDNYQKQDSNRGRNTLMAAADDDLQKMVDDRNDARYRRDYDGADAIREELRTIFRVEIYDKLGEWVAADGRWGLSNRKRGAGSEDGVPVLAKIQQADAVACSLTYDQIMDLVIKRTNARRNRQFQEADDLRNELARVGVELFDKVNEWRTYDNTLRGLQSEDFSKYEVKKDNERYDRGGQGNARDNAW
mmetsp:Transcript_35685/g.33829  ORF Transcript_35685/g.33829 Transcript_35685/m.33829 type:complete len:446 (-) Transcript_35685:99-1436(-)